MSTPTDTPGRDLQVVDTTTGEVVSPADATRTLSPADRIGIAAEAASEAGKLIEQHGLAQQIQGRRYIRVEGWQLFAQALDMTIIVEAVDPLPDGAGWSATAVVRTADGREVGRGQTVVTRQEKRWQRADEYAVMSMAQTRAIGRAARAALGYVAVAAGYEATPAEEVGDQPGSSTPPWAVGASDEQWRELGQRWQQLAAMTGVSDDVARAAFRALVAPLNGARPVGFVHGLAAAIHQLDQAPAAGGAVDGTAQDA